MIRKLADQKPKLMRGRRLCLENRSLHGEIDLT